MVKGYKFKKYMAVVDGLCVSERDTVKSFRNLKNNQMKSTASQ